MKELNRTLIFVAVAAASLGAAAMTHLATRPKAEVGYSRVGEEFYPEFKDPTAAQVLRVVAYDKQTASVKVFKVEYRDGKWRIPSHHDYPADGKDRLARTAASVIGTSRVALVSRTKSDQATYDVVDPEDPDSSILTGRGQKITISKNDGTVLAEFVIGKKSDRPGQTDAYYLRATKTDDANTIYLAKLKIDLSTKFSDWIEPSLLKVDRDALSDIRIDSYTIDEQQMQIVPGEVTELTKKGPNDPWKLAGMNDQKEELKTDVVNNLVNSLDTLKLVGVRPKPQGVKADLSLEPRIAQSPELVFALRNDMANRGFLVAKDPRSGKPHIFSKEGEMEAGANDGVRYALRFGQIFTGSDFEIETGLSKDAKDTEKKDAEKKDGEKKDAETKGADRKKAPDASTKPNEKDKESLKKSRYLMVFATFDRKLVGESPVKPGEPKKPEGLVNSPARKPADSKNGKPHAKAGSPTSKPEHKQTSATGAQDSQLLAMAFDDPKAAPPAKSDSAAKKDSSKPTTAKPPAGKPPAAKPAAAKPAGAKAPAAKPSALQKPVKPDPKAEYQKAMDQYKKDVEKYQNDKSEYEKKLASGEKKVKELNDRFGPWYYVISAESFENLRLNHSSLVKPKEKPVNPAGAAIPQIPGLPPGR